VSSLATLETSPRVPPCVHSALVHPLESPCQQCQLVLSKYIELLVWLRHQKGQRVHLGGWVSVRLSTEATDESKTMRVSRALETGYQTTINLSRLELRKQLVHR
jgi:hypothetical protein